MIDTAKIFEYSKDKTRVLVLSSVAPVVRLLKEVLDFNQKDADFVFSDGTSLKENNDFVVFETSDLDKAAAFQPNIALITDEINVEGTEALLKNIVSGGVLIYPENFEETVQNSENYFRKLPFSNTEILQKSGQNLIKTAYGDIPVNTSDENLLLNIGGIKLLAQQFGVMEEEFYEPLIGF